MAVRIGVNKRYEDFSLVEVSPTLDYDYAVVHLAASF